MQRLVLTVIILAALLLPQPLAAQPAERCFAETGYCISGAIRSYWERNGGLAVFGYPKTALTAESVEGVRLAVQWFERDRLEIQPDGRITAGRLGAEILSLQGTPWQFGAAVPAQGDCLMFSETGHQVCGAFAAYWQRQGGLERFGFPISGEFSAEVEGRIYSVQYFERRRFEWHSQINGGSVLLGLLGNDVVAARAAGAQPTGASVAAAQPAGADAEQTIVIGGNGAQSLTVTVPFGGPARVLFDDDSGAAFSLLMRNSDGSPAVSFSEALGRQNSAALLGSGRSYRVDVTSSGTWRLTLRPLLLDPAAGGRFSGFGRGVSDYWYLPAIAGQIAEVSYAGTGGGELRVQLICGRSGTRTLVERSDVTALSVTVPLSGGDELCLWDVTATNGYYVVGVR